MAIVGPVGLGQVDAAAGPVPVWRDPSAGAVLVNGVDLADLDPDDWRASVAWLPQDPTLPGDTVRDVVRMGDPSLSDDEIRTALAEVGLDLDLDRPLGEGSPELSAGQRAASRSRGACCVDLSCCCSTSPRPTSTTRAPGSSTAAITRRKVTRVVATHRPFPADVTVSPRVTGGPPCSLSAPPGARRPCAREATRSPRALAAGLLVTLSSVGLAGTSAWLIVRAAQRPAVLSLTVPMGLVQLFALAKAAGRYVERTQTHRAALGVMGHARATVAALLEPLVPAGLGPRSAEVVDLVVRDVDRVQDLLTAVAGPLVTSVAAGLVTAVDLLDSWCRGRPAVLVVALVPRRGRGAGARGPRGRGSEGRIDAARAQMVALFDEASRSGDEYVMSGAAAGLRDRLDDLERRLDRARARRTLVAGAATALGVLVSGGAAAAALVLTSSALSTGHVSAALIAVPALLVVAVLELVAGVSPALAGWRGDVAALGRIESLAAPRRAGRRARDPRDRTRAVPSPSRCATSGSPTTAARRRGRLAGPGRRRRRGRGRAERRAARPPWRASSPASSTRRRGASAWATPTTGT